MSETLLDIARVLADSRSPCPGGATGCILATDEGRILSTGYNGPPHGWDDALGSCARDKLDLHGGVGYEVCPCVHAEANAVAHAARNGVAIGGAVAYCTRAPCSACCKVLVQAGIQTCFTVSDGKIVSLDLEDVLANRIAQAKAHFGA